MGYIAEYSLYALDHTSTDQGFRLQTRGFPGRFSFFNFDLGFWPWISRLSGNSLRDFMRHPFLG